MCNGRRDMTYARLSAAADLLRNKSLFASLFDTVSGMLS